MIQVEERRRRIRTSPLDTWLRDSGGSMLRRVTAPLRNAGRRLWENAVLAVMTVALVGAAAVFFLLGAVEFLKELKLPPWLAYGLLGTAGALAGFLLWRGAFGNKA